MGPAGPPLTSSRHIMAPPATIRTALKCRRCKKVVVVLSSAPIEAQPPANRRRSFACPACGGENADVELPATAIEQVILDPRKHKRS